MEDIVNPGILSISTYLKKGRSMITKSAIVDVNVRESHLIGDHHVWVEYTLVQTASM
jgi:hypothetical protein